MYPNHLREYTEEAYRGHMHENSLQSKVYYMHTLYLGLGVGQNVKQVDNSEKFCEFQ